QWLTVSYGLRCCFGGLGRPNAPAGVRAVAMGAETGRRARARPAGQPAGGLAASEGLEGGGARGGPAGGRTARLLYRSQWIGGAACLARPVLGSGPGRVSERS